MTNDQQPSISPAASRMRRHRQRRRDGFSCVVVELRETEIDALVDKGLLKPDTRHSKNAIINALHAFFDHTLSMTP
jgi:hypothetical protein